MINGQERIMQCDSEFDFEVLFNEAFNLFLEQERVEKTTEILYDSIFPESYFYLQSEEIINIDSNQILLNFKKLFPDFDVNVDYRYGNVCPILINNSDSVFIRGESFERKDEFTKFLTEFLTNPNDKEDLPEKRIKTVKDFGEVVVTRQIIFLNAQMVLDSLNQRTSFPKLFMTIKNIISVNNELRDKVSNARWKIPYQELEISKRIAINEIHPLWIRITLNYKLPSPPPPLPPDFEIEKFMRGEWKNEKK